MRKKIKASAIIFIGIIIVSSVPLWHISGNPLEIPKAHAAPAPGSTAWLGGTRTNVSTNINLSAAAIEWSISDVDPAYFDHTAPGSVLSVRRAGDYFVAVTVPMSGNVSRSAVQAEIYVNGVPAAGSIGESSYIRNTSGHTESSDHIATLLTGLLPNDEIEVFVRQTAAAGTVTISGQASLLAEYVNPARTAFSGFATQTTNGTNLNQSTAYPLEWTEDRKNSGFTHSDSANSENITLDQAGDYLIFVNIPLNGTANRANVRLMVTDDGATVPGGEGKQGYIRNGSGHNDSSIHWSGLVTNVGAASVLTIAVQREGGGGTVTVPAGKQASLYIEKIDTTSDVYFGRGADLTGGTNWNPSSPGHIEWGSDDIIDTSVFTHSTTINPHEITVEQDGDYLLVYNDALTAGSGRPNPKITVEVNGASRAGAETKSHYIRGSNGHNESSGSLTFLLTSLTSGDVITIETSREADSDTVNDTHEALLMLWRKPPSGPPDVVVSEIGTQALSLDAPSINQYVGGAFVLTETASSRQVTGITIAETGTVNAASSLENIKLFYESDITTPYDCISESFDGSEAQFGATDIDGFSASDGTSTFTDSVTISTTAALCVYTVLDINAGASNGQTIEIEISNPSQDIAVDSGTVSPATVVAITDTTTIQAPNNMQQIHYRWRNDNGGEGSQLWNVQSYQGNFGPSAFAIVPINAVTSLDRAFILAPASHMSVGRGSVNGNQNANEVLSRARFTATDEVTLERDSATNDSLYSFFVVENPSGSEIAVKYGTTAFIGNNDTDLDINVGSGITDYTNTMVFFTASSNSSSRNYYNQAHVRGFMTSNTNLALRRTAGNSIVTVDWFVVEFIGLGWNIQQGDFTLTTGTDASPQPHTISRVAPADAFVFMNWEASHNGLDRVSAKVELANATTLNFSRQDTNTGTITARWFVAEHADLNVQRGTDTAGASDVSESQTITSVDTTRTIPVTFNDVNGQGNAFPRPYWRARLLNPSTLFWDRARTGQDSNFRWQVIEFPDTIGGGATFAAVEDTKITDITVATPIRLRFEVTNKAGAALNNIQFRLEVSEANPANCAVGIYTRVDTAPEWDMISSSFFTDGDPTQNIIPGLTDENPDFLPGELKDANDQTNATTIGAAEFTEIEYAIQATPSAASPATYCFRLTDAGSPANITYVVYAEAEISGEYLSAYRWFENEDATTVTNALALQDSPATLTANGQTHRLRIALHFGITGPAQGEANFKLQFARRSGSCDEGFMGEAYSDITTATEIALYNNPTPADEDVLTTNPALDPAHGAHSVVSQTYKENGSFANSIAAIPAESDGLWDFALIDLSAPSKQGYCFRVVRSDDSLLDSYTLLPELVIAAAYNIFGTYISNDFNTGTPHAFNVIEWEESVTNPACILCQIRLQIKTAPDAGGVPGAWSPTWSGPDGEDGDETDYFTNSDGSLIHTDHNDDQWVRYRATFDGDGTHTSILENVQINYQ